jgi:hypothetical protein
LKRVIPNSAWVLLGLLAVAAFGLSLGRPEVMATPAADSFMPSGTRAFAELLKAQGYEVSISRSTLPRLRPDDVALAYFRWATPKLTDENESPTVSRLLEHVGEGGTLVAMPFNPDYRRSTFGAREARSVRQVFPRRDRTLEVHYDPEIERTAAFGLRPALEPALDLWQSPEGEPISQLFPYREGRILVVRDGLMATNRFIDQGENARFLLDHVARVAPSGSRIVLTEATFGRADSPSLTAAIGPWAQGAWWQILFLFVVIVYTLGKRFGLPDEHRRRQQGQRELAEAISDTYDRARMTGPALEAVLEDALWRLRRGLKIPQDTPEESFAWQLPETLQSALHNVRHAAEMKATPDQALRLAQRLEAELSRYGVASGAAIHPGRRRSPTARPPSSGG